MMDPLLVPALEVNPALILAGGVEAPKTGEEFLANVIIQRSKCKEIVSAPVPRIENRQTYFVTEPGMTEPAPECFTPTLEWQNLQVADFSQLRLRLFRLKNEKGKWTGEKSVPLIDDPFCTWLEFFEKHDPLLSQMFLLTQNYIDLMLEILGNILEEVKPGKSISKGQGKWLFAALATVKLPLRSSTHALLRNTARLCSQIRSRLSVEDKNLSEKITPLNLFICLIARYFNQTDLIEN